MAKQIQRAESSVQGPGLPVPRMVYRAMGQDSAWERIGVGVMDKAGKTIDHADLNPPTWSLVYVLRGHGTYHDQHGGSHALRAGDCFQRIPGQAHTTRLDPTSQWLEAWIDFGPALSQALITMQIIRPEPLVWHWGFDYGRIARIAALMEELDRAPAHALADLCVRCQALVVEAFAVAQRSTGHDDPIDRLCRILADEVGTRLDLRCLCARERLDYGWIRKEFRRRLGVSPAQYRIRRRIERACALLHTTTRDLAGIADELGYHSAYEFSAQFRAWMNIPPSRYRSAGRLG